MSWVIGLILLAAVLLSFEIIIPGAVMGLLGLFAYFAACLSAGVQFGYVMGVLTFIVGGIFLGGLLYIEFKWIPHTSLGGQLFLNKKVLGKSNAGFPDEVIGKTVEALTPLRPTGLILLDGERYEALSKDGYIKSGEELKVIAKDNFRVVVTKI
jgi:membrane-bound serine protease (ClpP class)